MITAPKTIGIIGGGQLARMIAIEAQQMGYTIAILEPQMNSPASYFADYIINAPYDDQQALTELARLSAVVTCEFENVPAQSLAYIANHPLYSCQVFPDYKIIALTQNRSSEKKFLQTSGIKIGSYCPINNITDLVNCSINLFPAILKTNTLGYDGHGQIMVNNHQELGLAYQKLAAVPCVLEKVIDIKIEVSTIAVAAHNQFFIFPIAQNTHDQGILKSSLVPADLSFEQITQITQITHHIVTQLNYIGVLGVEYFIDNDNNILVNELAPRVHNSGHYTQNLCSVSQFKAHIQAICGLKIRPPQLLFNYGAMINILGDAWFNYKNNSQILIDKYDNVALHFYDKKIVKPKRKMGHINLWSNDKDQLLQQLKLIQKLFN